MTGRPSGQGGPMTRHTPNAPLEPGEQVVESWFANHTQHAQRATGGRLYLTDRRLTFEPHGLDRALAGKTWSVPLKQIVEVGTTPVDLRHFFGGGLRRRLKVVLRDGSEWYFVLNKLNARVETIRAALPGGSRDGS